VAGQAGDVLDRHPGGRHEVEGLQWAAPEEVLQMVTEAFAVRILGPYATAPRRSPARRGAV